MQLKVVIVDGVNCHIQNFTDIKSTITACALLLDIYSDMTESIAIYSIQTEYKNMYNKFV